MRLFSTLWPASAVVDDLRAALTEVRDRRPGIAGPGLRFGAEADWHVTLAFHGENVDRAPFADRLRSTMTGLRAPRLRLAGVGTFPKVLWARVVPEQAADEAALTALVAAAGGDPDDYQAHLTLARWKPDADEPRALTSALADYVGPSWQPAEASLVESGPTVGGGSRFHRVLDVALTR
ncbi:MULTISPECIES: 2'-5' RNA ligase family protein [Actinoalloteichus]|uniref:2'-5' RNA ligase n=1 Tax=Actinoalloteichus fjordicus TaxID=1612552 RepID=A0AAC9LBP6_9PSEU|nr:MULTISPECIES: 2'-5' RNA ligase family protein [Actinoalloteichus]APU13935.1 2'-5' RNA ligase [Actinoalloteichus fjordicus]APU19881.1 2'-5' RNA ligase [Actinoalloteichus sp. GBA129-24]